MEVGVTLDERIADGFYFIKSMYVLQDILNHPEQLMQTVFCEAEKPKHKLSLRHRLSAMRRLFRRKSA